MKNTVFFYPLIFFAIFVFLFAACKERIIDITGITLNKKELSLLPGETETLIATISPNDATNQEVIWVSSNTSVATVSSNGLITAMDNGETTITVITKDGYKRAECYVTVDYRSQWTGDWDFVVKIGLYSIDSYPIYDTIYYSGSITKSISHPNKIVVEWGDGTIATINDITFTQKSELTVSSNGKLTYPEYGGSGHTYFYNTSHSYISGDTICFGISAGGLGRWRQWEVTGLKTKITKY